MSELLSALSDEQLREQIKVQQELRDWHRAMCMSEWLAQGKDITGEYMKPEGKRETDFMYHPDSRLFCVHGKNRIGLDGVLTSEAEEVKHRNLWCKYRTCKPTATASTGVQNVQVDTNSNPAGMMSSASLSCCCLLAIVGLVSLMK
jgi:hypothetical protein